MKTKTTHTTTCKSIVALVLLFVFVNAFAVEHFGGLFWESTQSELVDFEEESDTENDPEKTQKKSGDDLIAPFQNLRHTLFKADLIFSETIDSEIRKISDVLNPPPETL